MTVSLPTTPPSNQFEREVLETLRQMRAEIGSKQ